MNSERLLAALAVLAVASSCWIQPSAQASPAITLLDGSHRIKDHATIAVPIVPTPGALALAALGLCLAGCLRRRSV